MPNHSQSSVLRDIWAAAGARFGMHRGREVAEEFAGVVDEYWAARKSVVVADRSYRARIRVTGKDRLSFLQNMLTNDIMTLETGRGMRAALLTRKGTLVSDLTVYQLGELVLLEMEPEGLTPTLEGLSHYLVSEDVTLTDATGEETLFSVEGPGGSRLLATLFADLDEGELTGLARYQFLSASRGERAIRVSAAWHGPGTAFDVAVPADGAVAFLDRLLDAGRAVELRPAGWQALEIRRIEAGIPLLGIDMSSSNLPLEAGLDDAISFNKGCYIGQEYVVRLAHRGHLNRKLTGLALSDRTIPRAGDEILAAGESLASQKAVGRVTSAAFSPGLEQSIAMGYLQSAFLDPGTVVAVRSAQKVLDARVTELPFLGHSS